MDDFKDYIKQEQFPPYEEKTAKGFDPGVINNIMLFLLTFASTTLAGVQWIGQDPYELTNFSLGLTYSTLIMSIITAHEFGHYFAARIHKVNVTLPYYIPFPFLFLNPFGTMGAVIRMKQRRQSKKALFDIGVAGPIAGWIVALGILIYGFATLPPQSYLFDIHPQYIQSGVPLEGQGLTFGRSLLYAFLEKVIPQQGAFVPPMNEMYHYPWLCVGWFGLLITSLNMLPIGQLDGGHISYTMLGEKHKYIAWTGFVLLLIFGVLGLLPLIGIDAPEIGSTNWLVWAALIYFVIKVEHPRIVTDENAPLGTGRILTGLFSYFILIVSFIPVPVWGGEI